MKGEIINIATTLFASFVFLSACDNLNSSSTNQNEKNIMTKQHEDSIKQFIYHYVDDVWNKRDIASANKYWGNDFKNVFAPQLEHGPEGMKKQVAYFLNAFAPFHFEIKDIMIDGDKISAWCEISGTHTGELFGIKATMKEVRFREAVWWRMKDGKLDEVYPFVDWNSLFEQLGEYPKLESK